MALAQRFLKISGQCYVFDATDTMVFPAPADFIIRGHPQVEEYPRDTYELNKFTHGRQWYYDGELKLAEYDDEWFAGVAEWSRGATTGGLGLAEMETGVVATNAITLANVPIADSTVHVMNPANRLVYKQGVAAAAPNVYSIAAGVLTFDPTDTPDGTILKITYIYYGLTAARIVADPYAIPHAFTLYAAKAIVWPATGIKQWAVMYARSCVIADTVDALSKEEVTVRFNVNNVVTNDLYIDRPQISES